MACERDRIVKIIEYLESLGITVNIGKNKARGNKGFFKVKGNQYRIDIANSINDEELFPLVVHEFAHFLHFKYDKTLKSLDFILKSKEETLQEEMIALTVEQIPKKSIAPLFKAKEELMEEIPKTFGIASELRKHALRRVNSKISRLNRYYNQPTELFARALEMYFTSYDSCKKLAPIFTETIDCYLKTGKIAILCEFAKACNNTN